MTMRRLRSMPVSRAMGPSGSVGEGQLIGFGVGPVLTTFADVLPGSAGCCAATSVAPLTIIQRGHWRDFMTPDSTATGCTLRHWARSAPADPEPDTTVG